MLYVSACQGRIQVEVYEDTCSREIFWNFNISNLSYKYVYFIKCSHQKKLSAPTLFVYGAVVKIDWLENQIFNPCKKFWIRASCCNLLPPVSRCIFSLLFSFLINGVYLIVKFDLDKESLCSTKYLHPGSKVEKVFECSVCIALKIQYAIDANFWTVSLFAYYYMLIYMHAECQLDI